MLMSEFMILKVMYTVFVCVACITTCVITVKNSLVFEFRYELFRANKQ